MLLRVLAEDLLYIVSALEAIRVNRALLRQTALITITRASLIIAIITILTLIIIIIIIKLTYKLLQQRLLEEQRSLLNTKGKGLQGYSKQVNKRKEGHNKLAYFAQHVPIDSLNTLAKAIALIVRYYK